MQDGKWYAGEPVWVAAEKAGMVTAAYYFVGTEADIQGVPMSHWHVFDASVPGQDRVDQVLEWLAMPDEERPHFITLYFEDVDTLTHGYGPGSDRSVAAMNRVNGYLEQLMTGIEALPIKDEVYLVVVSDHGQLWKKVDDEIFIIKRVIDTDGMIIVDHGASAYIYLEEPDHDRAIEIRDALNAAWSHGKAILREDAPKAWRLTEEAGFADIIVMGDPGYLVYSSELRVNRRSRGDHGWVPEEEGMHATFLASGPRLPKGERIGAINAVDVYPLLMEILELPITTPIDGDPGVLTPLLK